MPNEDNNGQDRIRHASDSQGQPPPTGVTRTLSELARELLADPDMDTLLRHIVAATVGEIDGADYGGITLVEAGTLSAVAATDPIVQTLDQRQNELQQGPCVSSLREQITVRADDLATEQRWPAFANAATTAGIRSMLSAQLFVEGDNFGALNLYARTPAAFDQVDEHLAVAFAAHAAVAVKGSRIETNLTIALRSRDVIGQAKGILMERYKINAEEAFQLMVLSSQSTHIKLREVADELTATGELATR